MRLILTTPRMLAWKTKRLEKTNIWPCRMAALFGRRYAQKKWPSRT
jgi:hypothetical protein